MTTPAEELRAAARHLREVAAECTPGPWMSAGSMSAGSNRMKNSIALIGATANRGTGKAIAVLAGDPKTRGRDAQLLALFDPNVAELFAAWLDDAATANLDFYFANREKVFHHELAIARAINTKAANK